MLEAQINFNQNPTPFLGHQDFPWLLLITEYVNKRYGTDLPSFTRRLLILQISFQNFFRHCRRKYSLFYLANKLPNLLPPTPRFSLAICKEIFPKFKPHSIEINHPIILNINPWLYKPHTLISHSQTNTQLLFSHL